MTNTQIEAAQITLDVEFPGHSYDSALAEAGNRQQNAYEKLDYLKREQQRIQFEIDQETQNFADAQRAASEFQAVMDVLDAQEKEG